MEEKTLGGATREIKVRSTPGSKEKIEREIIEDLEKMCSDEDILFSVKLALEEAVVNAIKHGNKSNPNKTVIVNYTLGDYCIRITVEDEGRGFDLDAIPDPTAEENLESDHGRGILLMRVYMDEVKYNEKGNQVTLVKYLSRDE